MHFYLNRKQIQSEICFAAAPIFVHSVTGSLSVFLKRKVGTELKRFDIRQLNSKVYVVDPVSKYDFDNPAFNIYLLGHDSVAEHRIHFSENDLKQIDIKWDGKIALTYAGQYEFLHSFKANLSNVSFQGFDIPEELSDKRTFELLEKFTVELERYTIKKLNGQRRIIIN